MAINIDPAPTTGLSTPVYITLAGTGLTVTPTSAVTTPNSGPYNVTLSVSAAGGKASSVVVTPTLVDVSNASQSATVANWTYRSYNDPQITEASIYTGSLNGANIAPKPTSTAKIASVGASGASTVTVTALNPGQAIVEINYPSFGNSGGTTSQGNLGGPSAGTAVPTNAIGTQLIVTVNA
jgi:hypothetical protein